MLEALAATLTDEDILELLDGKKVNTIKFDKNLRREVKHAIKREEVPLLFLYIRISILLTFSQETELSSIIKSSSTSL